MTGLAERKALARDRALARRDAAHTELGGADRTGLLRAVLDGYRGRPLAGYLPIRSEIDPRPAMVEAARHGPVAVPVIRAAGAPLAFSAWTPGGALRRGPFGVMVPEEDALITPEVLIVPLVAFTAQGGRLGYGGGYYDRTLADLRAAGGAVAIGFAYGAQQQDGLPEEDTDAPLDLIVTEAEVITP